MRHYDGPTFFRQHPEELERRRQQRTNRLIGPPTEQSEPSTSSQAVRYGSAEIEIDRSTASLYAAQQARAIAQTINPHRKWHTPASAAASTVTDESGYVSATPKVFNQTSVAFSANNKPVASVWGDDDWSHSESVAPATDSSQLSTQQVESQSQETTKLTNNEVTVKPHKDQLHQIADGSDTAATSSRATLADHSQGVLGHGLAAIFDEEQNGQKALALFNHDRADDDLPNEVNSEVISTPDPAETIQQTGRSYATDDDRELLTYHFPSLALLKPPVQRDEAKLDAWLDHQIDVLNQTLSAFNIDGEVVDFTVGPTVTQFQVSLGPGVRVNKITNLQDDLKLALAAKDIRIEAPIPGQSTVGIEIPDLKSRPVMLSEVLRSEAFQKSTSPLTVALGVDLFGQPQVTDLRKMPHGLIAGATGSGKSVFINSLLMSILYKATPQEVKLILIDPKAVEMAPYNGIPHLLAPVVSEPQAAAAALKWTVNEMDERYQRLAAAGARNIEQYNDKAKQAGDEAAQMPYILVIIDELADLMMVAASEVQDYIARITQKARAAGIHLLVATQRPSVDVVTGTIKNNIPTRLAFMVASQIDSRTILDTAGAERLLGRGDMLYLGNGKSQPIRLQGTFVDAEIDPVTDFVREQMAPHYAFEPKQLLATEIAAEDQDELWPQVLAYIAEEKNVSTSKLQRVFSIGYNRAANLVDQLESRGYVSAQQGSKPREVFFTAEQLAETRNREES
ncbi:DNA translocase FtsK [Furfurilactobacillus curtus]|uniref:DNA translocase FtsK n=1 Tax=Furfurilactobacillus curtus TaxID=1746200 RepID=A0ABQ5JNU9_9LACO